MQNKIWTISNDVRGAVDGWDFKQYILGALFYRFISEDFSLYMKNNYDNINYTEISENFITEEIKKTAIEIKGYFIYPYQLFQNVVKNVFINNNLNNDLKKIFLEIENSAKNYPSENKIKGLFADFDTTSNRLGNTEKDKNSRLAIVLNGIATLEFDYSNNKIDLFGDAYEFLISNYSANAGKSGGEFFTPQNVSQLIAQIAMHKQTKINKIYDPTCGSGSLLLQAKKNFETHAIEKGFFGQELNSTSYNLARMNMFLRNINYDKFNIELGDTLTEPHFLNDKPFDVIVSNPPYSVKWIGSDDPKLIKDDRFAPAGILAPKSKADFAFVLHALNYLSDKGRAVIVCFPGIFYRAGAEQKIRQYLVDNNYIETIISLPPNLFYSTTISVTILVLAKNKINNDIQFIDASNFFIKEARNNILTEEHIKKIIEIYDSKENIVNISKRISYKEIADKDYNLSVSSYIENQNNKEIIDIKKLNQEIANIVTNIDRMRIEWNDIINDLES